MFLMGRYKSRCPQGHFGLYQVPNITSDALQAAIKDTLLRMNLSLARCRGSAMMVPVTWLEQKVV